MLCSSLSLQILDRDPRTTPQARQGPIDSGVIPHLAPLTIATPFRSVVITLMYTAPSQEHQRLSANVQCTSVLQQCIEVNHVTILDR
jgi:hypothetical protein